VTLTVDGVSSSSFTSYQTSVATSLAAKNPLLASGGGTGMHILDTATNVVKRIRLYGNVSTSSDANEVLVHIMGRTDAQVDALLNAKQATLNNNSGSAGTELLTGTTLRKIRAGSNISLATVDGDISISASSAGGVTQTQVDSSIATALTSYTLTSDINSALAQKQDTLVSGVSTGDFLFDASTNTVKKIDFTADFQTSNTGAKLSVALSTPLSQLQPSLSNFAVSGFELFAQNKLKRIQVPINLSLGVPLVMSESTTGQLELTSNSYSSSMTDTLLAQKQASLVVSNVSGSSLLSGSVLKRVDVGTGLSLSDSGHALTLANTMDNWGAGSVDLLYNGALRGLSFSGPLGHAYAQNFAEVIIDCNAYSKQESDARYLQIASELTVSNSNGPYLQINSISTRTDMRYFGGVLRFRRVAPDGTFRNKCDFPDGTGAVNFNDGISQSSDSRIKSDQKAMRTQDALEILTAVQAKTYARNDQNGALKHGFIAQEMEAAVAGKPNFECLVGSADDIKTMDYPRLTAILWTCVRDLHSRVQALESALG
jgi:hypothetical protein